MAQTFTSTDVIGTTNVKTDNIASRINENTLRSSFSGTSFPDSPVLGQHCYREDITREYTWNGVSWVDSDTNSTVYNDVKLSAGNLPTLNTRLAVSMNDDGTLKATPTAVIDEFKDNALAITYVSTSSFTTPNDLTSTFTQYRKVKCIGTWGATITSITTSSYDSGTNKTTVTLKDSVIDATIIEVKFGVIQDGLPENVLTSGTESTIGTANVTTLNMSGAINQALTTMASASIMNIGTAAGNHIIVTGMTTVTAFDTPQAGTKRTLRFSDTVTITYNAVTMLLPGAANIVAYAGDVLEFTHEGSGVWRCIDIQRYKTFRGCYIYLNTSNQSVASSASPKIILNAVNYDTNSFWNTTNTRIEIPVGISYIKITASLLWNDAVSTYGRRLVQILKNGTSYLVNSNTTFSSNGCYVQITSPVIPVSSGDYFELYATNNDTAAKSVYAGVTSTFLSMEVLA
jgi:hypothetical protein